MTRAKKCCRFRIWYQKNYRTPIFRWMSCSSRKWTANFRFFHGFALWKRLLGVKVAGAVVNTCRGNLCKYECRAVQYVVERSRLVFGAVQVPSFFLPCFTTLFSLFAFPRVRREFESRCGLFSFFFAETVLSSFSVMRVPSLLKFGVQRQKSVRFRLICLECAKRASRNCRSPTKVEAGFPE